MKTTLILISLLLFTTLLIAEKMPEFKLPDVNGNDVKMTDLLNNGPVIIDFWASWCIPCKKGMVALNKMAQKYDSLTIVVVSIDSPKDVPKAKTYLKSNAYKFIGLFDSDMKLAKKLNVVNPPRTFILDKTGEILLTHEGYEAGTEKIYEAKVREMLSLPAIEESPAEPVTPAVPAETTPCGGCK